MEQWDPQTSGIQVCSMVEFDAPSSNGLVTPYS